MLENMGEPNCTKGTPKSLQNPSPSQLCDRPAGEVGQSSDSCDEACGVKMNKCTCETPTEWPVVLPFTIEAGEITDDLCYRIDFHIDGFCESHNQLKANIDCLNGLFVNLHHETDSLCSHHNRIVSSCGC